MLCILRGWLAVATDDTDGEGDEALEWVWGEAAGVGRPVLVDGDDDEAAMGRVD